MSSSSAAGGIQGLLLKLHESLSDEDKRAAALRCHDIVGDLGQECMLTPSDTELGENERNRCIKNEAITSIENNLNPRQI